MGIGPVASRTSWPMVPRPRASVLPGQQAAHTGALVPACAVSRRGPKRRSDTSPVRVAIPQRLLRAARRPHTSARN
jgi:hypothetical protein